MNAPDQSIERWRVRVVVELEVAALVGHRDLLEAYYQRLLQLNPPPAAYVLAESVRVEPVPTTTTD